MDGAGGGNPLRAAMPADAAVAAQPEADEDLRLVSEVKAEGRPSALLVYAALVVTQTSFGGGSVVGKFGVHGTNPVLFALIREGTAGPLLCVAAAVLCPERPDRRDAWRFIACGFCIFLNQLCFILGDKLADPTTGSVWQPSQPVLTTALAVAVGYEGFRWRTAVGLALAIAGAIFMVSYGQETGGGRYEAAGHVLFFFNCLGTSGYVILSKPFFKRMHSRDGCVRVAERGLDQPMYNPLSVTGWSYIIGSVLMLCAALVVNTSDPPLRFVCHDKDSETEDRCVDGPWRVPVSMLWCLAYWIVFNSIVAYGLMTWANKYAKASLVSTFTVLQPLTSAAISYILVAVKGTDWADSYGLEKPGIKDLGIVGIVLGLLLVVTGTRPGEVTGEDSDGSKEETEAASPATHTQYEA